MRRENRMDFLKWAKSRTLPKALQTRAGWAQLFEHSRTEEPHIHQIEPTNVCPYTCIMCPRHNNMTRENMKIISLKRCEYPKAYEIPLRQIIENMAEKAAIIRALNKYSFPRSFAADISLISKTGKPRRATSLKIL